jgi:hypothetical protein
MILADSNAELLKKLRTSSADDLTRVDPSFQHSVAELILCRESDVADRDELSRYFGTPRFPGTSSIGLRRTKPELFQDTIDSVCESYADWVHRRISDVVIKMDARGLVSRDSTPADHSADEFARKIVRILDF